MADQFTISRNIFTEEILDFFDNVPPEIASVLPELIISKPDGLEFRNRGAREEIISWSSETGASRFCNYDEMRGSFLRIDFCNFFRHYLLSQFVLMQDFR